MRTAIITIWIAGGFMLAAACKNPKTTKIETRRPAMSISTDETQLRNYIKFPVPPQGVRWVKEDHPGGADFTLAAALHYGPEAISKILEGSDPFDVQPSVRISRDVAVGLLPESTYKASGDGETVALEGIAVQPNLFVDPKKSSLIHGRIVVMKLEGIVFLSLFTM